jgi:hypothetical protein
MEMLNLSEKIEDILITLDTQYHMIRPLTSRSGKGLFLYLALRRDRSNLAMARHHLRRIENDLDVGRPCPPRGGRARTALPAAAALPRPTRRNSVDAGCTIEDMHPN